jgi:hypothetical protein
MGSWRFFDKPLGGQNCVRVDWFWRVRHHDGWLSEAQTGFSTLRACIYDASRQGFTNTDDAVYDLSDTRWI